MIRSPPGPVPPLPPARAAAVATLCALLAAGALSAPMAGAAPWKQVANEKGVRVFTRPGSGGNLPEFMGLTVIRAEVYEILAVLDDIDRACEWTLRCAAMRELKRTSTTRRIIYSRSESPWPFADRDVVLRAVVSGMETGEDVVVSLRSIRSPLMPPVRGVVRMPVMDGTYRVRRVGPGRAEVTLRIRAHPGGMIPDWVAGWISKRMPIDTLDGLRRQVRKTRGSYEAFLRRFDPARRPPVAAPRAPTPTHTRGH